MSIYVKLGVIYLDVSEYQFKQLNVLKQTPPPDELVKILGHEKAEETIYCLMNDLTVNCIYDKNVVALEVINQN